MARGRKPSVMSLHVKVLNQWFIRCQVVRKNDVEIHIHSRWWRDKIHSLMAHQFTDDHPVAAYDITYDQMMDIVMLEDVNWLTAAAIIRAE